MSVHVSPTKGLALEDGLHAVEMVLNDAITLPASAGAITTTPGRDVMIRGRTDDAVFFTIGVDDAGYAALNMLWATPDTETPSQRTWTGHCQNYERHLRHWLGS